MTVREVEIENLPQFPLAGTVPMLTEQDYRNRFDTLTGLMETRGFTHMVVYGDREHFSNLHFLTGYDPRFEEALLIFSKDEVPILVVGNEGLNYANVITGEVRKELFGSFSLVGQPRAETSSLERIFLSAGIRRNSRVGVIGWKYFSEKEIKNAKYQIEIPYYIARILMDFVGTQRVENASDLMIHPEYGLRIRLCTKELVLHEMASTKTSQGVLNVIQNLESGLTEIEASRYLQVDGDPLTAHPNVNFGARNVQLGLASPSHTKTLCKGEVVNIALGYRRAMVARTGLFVRNGNEIPLPMKKVVESFYSPYYEALIKWYESIAIGVSGGSVFQAIKSKLVEFDKYGVSLNPGHLIHTDEWTNSIFYENSPYLISSGMAIQCDIIAFPGKPYEGVHVEDGVLVADDDLRNSIRKSFPLCWKRILKRKEFVKDTLGISLAEEVLPTSNIQAVLFPYMANTKIIFSQSH